MGDRCKAEFLLVEIDDAAGKADAVDGIEKENEKLVVKSKLNPDTLVVESNVVGAKDSDNIGEVADEKLVVASKLNPDTLVVASNVVGNNSRCLVIFCPCFGGSSMVHMKNG